MTLRTFLHAVPAGAPDPAPVPESTEEQAPVTPEPAPAKAGSTVARAWRTAGQTWRDGARREGGWVNFALRWHGPSVNDQRDYLRGRSWLEEGHEEGLADRAGEAFHAGIAIPAVAVLNAARAAASRPFVAAVAVIVALPWLFVALRLAGVTARVAGAVCGGLALAPVLYIALIMLAIAGYRERQRKRNEKKS